MENFLPPEAKKVLVLSPHPDDEALGCSGTISLYTHNGIDVHLVVVSKGEKSELKLENITEVRKSEVISSAKILGIKNTLFLEFPDEEINSYKEEIRAKLHDIIIDIEPDLIFAPFPLDPHPDHRATSEVILSLMRDTKDFKIAFYEIYCPIRFNILVDISSVIHKKKETVQNYEKSLLGIPDIFWHAIEGLNIYRSLVYRRKSFYEAFWLIDKPVSKNEILKWATFDYKDDPAEIFLSKLKKADRLIFELQQAQDFIELRDTEIHSLNKALQDTEKKLLKEKEKVLELKTCVDLLTNSLSWRLIQRYYHIRDKLLPDKTNRRNLYNKIVENLKKVTERA